MSHLQGQHNCTHSGTCYHVWYTEIWRVRERGRVERVVKLTAVFGEREREREREMFKQSLMVDSWIREAEEASRLMEDLENRIKYRNPEQQCLRDTARSKLLELGVKLDRLEALLHNPPSKPILTDQDLDFRWKMLSDIQLRTRAVALSLYATQSTNRPGSLPATRTADSYDQDHTKATFSKEDTELLMPLVSDDATTNQFQTKLSNSFASKSWIWKACWVIFVLLGAAAVLFFLVILCAVV